MRIDSVLKQRNIKGVGPFIDVLYLTSPLLGMGGYIMSAITMYTVTQVYIKPVLPWITLPIFFLLGFGFVLFLMASIYLLVYKSYFAFRNRQEYNTDNPIRKHLERQDKELAEIKRSLGVYERKI